MKHSIQGLFVTLAFCFATIAHAGLKTATFTEKNDRAKLVTELAAENAKNPGNLLLALAIGGASKEALEVIHNDLQKTNPGNIWPTVTIEKDEVKVDGKDTGVRFGSYAPLNLKYKGKTWVPDANATVDQNYLSLVKFLSRDGMKNASLAEWLIPSAHAEAVPNNKNVKVGLAAAALVSMMAVIYPPVGIAFALGATGALVYKSKAAGAGEATATHSKYLSSRVGVTCSPTEVTVHFKDADHKVVVTKDPATDKGTGMKVLDTENKPISGAVMGIGDLDKVMLAMGECKSTKAAKELEGKWNASRKKIKFMKAGPGGSESSDETSSSAGEAS